MGPQQKLHKTHVIKRNSRKNAHVIVMTKNNNNNRVMTRTAIKQLWLLPHENIINPRGDQNPTKSKTKNTQSQHLGGEKPHTKTIRVTHPSQLPCLSCGLRL